MKILIKHHSNHFSNSKKKLIRIICKKDHFTNYKFSQFFHTSKYYLEVADACVELFAFKKIRHSGIKRLSFLFNSLIISLSSTLVQDLNGVLAPFPDLPTHSLLGPYFFFYFILFF
eukprot:Lithocolla_globosa_v1_NODE_171_length_5468_cov_4.953076.p3 type:complete len:116 gc:universal NODE_171_length_5468_cov_4.953076:592-245(-)